MKRIKHFLWITSAIILLSACGMGDRAKDLQDMNQVNDGNNGEGIQQMTNPQADYHGGETYNQGTDRDKITQAAESIPGVRVERVMLMGRTARVTVQVNDENGTMDDERITWHNKIEKAVQKVVPRYKIEVNID